jgi:hypothetical protein
MIPVHILACRGILKTKSRKNKEYTHTVVRVQRVRMSLRTNLKGESTTEVHKEWGKFTHGSAGTILIQIKLKGVHFFFRA